MSKLRRTIILLRVDLRLIGDADQTIGIEQGKVIAVADKMLYGIDLLEQFNRRDSRIQSFETTAVAEIGKIETSLEYFKALPIIDYVATEMPDLVGHSEPVMIEL